MMQLLLHVIVDYCFADMLRFEFLCRMLHCLRCHVVSALCVVVVVSLLFVVVRDSDTIMLRHKKKLIDDDGIHRTGRRQAHSQIYIPFSSLEEKGLLL